MGTSIVVCPGSTVDSYWIAKTAKPRGDDRKVRCLSHEQHGGHRCSLCPQEFSAEEKAAERLTQANALGWRALFECGNRGHHAGVAELVDATDLKTG